jgi:hypothetical protein
MPTNILLNMLKKKFPISPMIEAKHNLNKNFFKKPEN